MQEIVFIKPNKKCLIVGVAGGSGSGKTYFAQELYRRLGPQQACLILQDDFYIDQSKKFDHDGGSVNFDHPSSLDFDLLASCLWQLKSGQSACIPKYDFVTHSRKAQLEEVQPHAVVIVDGILIAHSEPVRGVCDVMIFCDTEEKLRFERRLDRDVRERGRTPEGVRQQFLKQVKPMHDQFVEPSKTWAQFVVTDEGSFNQVMDQIMDLIKN